MNFKKLFASSLLGLLLINACATHNVNVASKATDETVSPEQLEVIASIPGPPTPGSAEDIADYKALQNFEKIRTAKECERASSESNPNLKTLYGAPYGPLTDKEVEKLGSLFEDLSKQTYHPDLIGMAKRKFHRARPYLTHTDLKPCIKKETSDSYPSGHAAISRIYYHVLSELYPDRTNAFLTRADQIALDRNIGGVHYPSDIRDGKILGDQAYAYMKKTYAYQQSIETFKLKK